MTGGSWISMPDACRVFRVNERTARRWAREDSWRRTSTLPKMYALPDIQASYDRCRVPGARVRQHLIRTHCQPAA